MFMQNNNTAGTLTNFFSGIFTYSKWSWVNGHTSSNNTDEKAGFKNVSLKNSGFATAEVLAKRKCF